MKKSSYSKKIVKLLKKEYKEDLEKSKIKTELNSSSADSKYQASWGTGRHGLPGAEGVCCVCCDRDAESGVCRCPGSERAVIQFL